MALPWIFASLATIITTYFDDDFAALGALTPIPCAVAGTDALTLTPNANTPTIAAYVNYQTYTGIAVANNTGSATAAVGALGALTIYKDGVSGPVALSANDIVDNNAIELLYDSALGGGSGGFHLTSAGPAAGTGTFLPLTGGTLTGPLIGTSLTMSGVASLATVIASSSISGTNIAASGTLSGVSIIATGRVTAASLAAVSIAATGALSGASIAIGAGALATRMLSTTASIVFGAIAPGNTSDKTIAVGGASIGDVVMIGTPASVPANIMIMGYVSATGIVSIRADNSNLLTTITPDGGVYRTTVMGFS